MILDRRHPLFVPLAAATGSLLILFNAPAQETEPLLQLECPSCDDNEICTVDTCDTTTGFCRHDPVICDQGLPCIQDFCGSDPNGFYGCESILLPVGTLCDDGNPCTVETACDSSGICVGQLLPPGEACDDGNPCTVDDACSSTGECAGSALPVGSVCDDGNLCTSGETCQELGGGMLVCSGTLKECDDQEACTVDICIPSTGECSHAPRDCDDRNVCTEDFCDPVRGCVRSPIEGSCDDGNACTTGDWCMAGNCMPGDGCLEGVECFTVTCDPFVGCIANENPNGTRCNLHIECDIFYCSRGFCEAQGLSFCDDFNPCTAEFCDYETGSCSYRDRSCDDANPCTLDTCDPQSGCVNAFDPELPDRDGDGVPDACDVCPIYPNPDQTCSCTVDDPDTDGDGVPDPCDNCPLVANPDQNICACNVFDIPSIGVRRSRLGQANNSAVVSWLTVDECDLRSFNVVEIKRNGDRVNLGGTLCKECVTGLGASYAFGYGPLKGGREIFIESIHLDGRRKLFGPADR